ncbi:TBC1 domain family member 30 C-terminal [Trinorchestia longiramus]|nr:TBC1 domain family member 30 C-terminal [Trinorchestia longiramus]
MEWGLLGRLVSESACEREDPDSNPATDMVDAARNTAWNLGQDTRMRFSVVPAPGDSGFCQWHSAMTMCARLPEGIPPEFRKRLWLTLAEHQLRARQIDWPEVERRCFNERTNPDDDELGDQIVKDLHRTGCSLFSGEDAAANQAMLKRVLLAYSRWNKSVGYCQGFNMLAAIILEEVDKNEADALKVMIYLIEGVLPESYFANNLRGLSVDMAVFRDLLRMRLPTLSRHLDYLRQDAADSSTGTCYEPPLTNVFTMQWFLTLFSNCLPKETVMRVWDLTFLQGNEVLLRSALAIWDRLAPRILAVQSADEFYTEMGGLTREMLANPNTIPPNSLVQSIVGMAPFPLPGLTELRDRYAYNITPWTLPVPSVSSVSSVSSAARRGLRLLYDDEDESEDDDDDSTNEKMAIAAAFGLSGIFRKSSNDANCPRSSNSKVLQTEPSSRPNLDISALKKQYARLRERQKQAHVILAASQINMDMGDRDCGVPRRRGSKGIKRSSSGKPGSLAGHLTSDMSDFTRSFASNLSSNIASNLTGRSQANFPTQNNKQMLGPNSRRASVDFKVGSASSSSSKAPSDAKPLTMNHLLRGKTALTSKTKRVVAKSLVVVPPVAKKQIDRKRRATNISPHHPQPSIVYPYPPSLQPLLAQPQQPLHARPPISDPDLPIPPSVQSRLAAAGHPCPIIPGKYS